MADTSILSGYAGMPVPSVPTPPGLESIYSALRRIYPDQPNPLQVTALVKYWLGGPDPLDFISMFGNRGSPMEGIPPHWHYISSGLSDLHGDGRVHEYTGRDGPSGYGYELTFRLKKEPGESTPPSWPAELLQALARYVFQTDNALCSGDHVSWHTPLDYTPSRISEYSRNPTRIQHILMADDPELKAIGTAMGTVHFMQIAGICSEELQAIQQWNGPAVLKLLQRIPHAGGPWLVTDMDRYESIFEIEPSFQEIVTKGIEKDGSNLSGVSVKCWWQEFVPDRCPEHCPPGSTNDTHGTTKDVGTRFPVLPAIRQNSSNSVQQPKDGSSGRRSTCSSLTSEVVRTRTLKGAHLRLGLEAALLLPLAIRGRLHHGRHFTYNSSISDTAVTFVSSNVTGSIADSTHPYAVCGSWLQILVSTIFLKKLDKNLDELTRPHELVLPKEYRWPSEGLIITVLPDE